MDSPLAKADRTEPRARPFLKWAGGKRQLLAAIQEALPVRIANYYEPFVGGGAVFFGLRFANATLGDVNEELINAYCMVRDEPAALTDSLAHHQRKHSRTHYYAVRAQKTATLEPVARAARLIYLNKTCFNGLYRVNRKGAFNVPIGSYAAPAICDAGNLAAAGRALAGVGLLCGDYRALADRAGAGDFVYFDPPYVPVSSSSSFVAYARGGFNSEDQAALADLFGKLGRRGVQCMLSNSRVPAVLELYKDHNIRVVRANRAVNSVGAGRGKVAEVLVTNY